MSNINLDFVLGYRKDCYVLSFLDDYDDKKNEM